jgi:hypothetical protein
VELTRDRTGEGQNRFHSSPSERIICRLENQRDCFEFRVATVSRRPVAAAATDLRRLPDPAGGAEARSSTR